MSPISSTEAALVNTAISVLPQIIALIRRQTPTGPTDAQILAALQGAITSSLATDEAWKAAHPTDGG